MDSNASWHLGAKLALLVLALPFVQHCGGSNTRDSQQLDNIDYASLEDVTEYLDAPDFRIKSGAFLYYIEHEGWHLHVQGDGEKRVFEGELTSKMAFTSLTKEKVESADSASMSAQRILFELRVSTGKDILIFDYSNKEDANATFQYLRIYDGKGKQLPTRLYVGKNNTLITQFPVAMPRSSDLNNSVGALNSTPEAEPTPDPEPTPEPDADPIDTGTVWFYGNADSNSWNKVAWNLGEILRCNGVPCPDSLAFSSNARNGARSFKVTIRRNQPLIAGGQRIELKMPWVNKDTEYWYGWSTYYPSDFKFDSKCTEIVSQWHNAGKGGAAHGPAMRMVVINDKIQLKATQHVDSSGKRTILKAYTGNVSRGRWTDWITRVKWNDNGNGLLELWRDGSKVFSKTGISTTYKDVGTYWKLGIYRRHWDTDSCDVTSPITLYQDEARVAKGSSKKSLVDPRNY